jgi:hypothetical protein
MIISLMLFAYSNGYMLSICFYYARNDIPENLKGLAGSTLSFFLNLGRFAGTLFAILVLKPIII